MRKPVEFIPYPAAATEIKEEAFLLRASAPAQASQLSRSPSGAEGTEQALGGEGGQWEEVSRPCSGRAAAAPQ